MSVQLAETPTGAPDQASGATLQDRVYARTFALTVRCGSTEDAIRELLDLAEGNPHLLGHVRGRLAQLADDTDGESHADRAVALATYAWLRAIAAV